MDIEMGDADDAAASAAHPSNSWLSNSSEGSGSAVRQVFELPELLQNILLYVSIEPDSLVSHTTHKNPSKDLFVLQRVSSTFRATISRNPTMQQRMFLAAGPAEPITDLDPYEVYKSSKDAIRSSFQWLLNKVGVSDNVLELRGLPEKLSTSFGPPVPKQLISRSSEASWRKMKLHCIQGCGPINLEYFTTYDTHIHVATFEEADNMTLGKLHDGLQVLMSLAQKYDVAEFWDAQIPEGDGVEMDDAEDRLQYECDVWQW